MNLGILFSILVMFSSIALSLCLWHDSEYTNKAASVLISSFILFLIDNEYRKNEN